MRFLNPLCLTGFLFLLSCAPGADEHAGQSDLQANRDTVLASPPVSAEGDKPLETVVDIQQEYGAVVGDKERGLLDSASFKYDCYGEKNGTVTYFTKNGALRMIAHQYSEYSHFNAVDRYFVKDSILFFAYLKSVTWAFEDGPEGATRDNIQERRIYLVNEQPVKCLEKKFVVHSKAENNLHADEVPNKIVDCATAEDVLKRFNSLFKYYKKSAPECLEL